MSDRDEFDWDRMRQEEDTYFATRELPQPVTAVAGRVLAAARRRARPAPPPPPPRLKVPAPPPRPLPPPPPSRLSKAGKGGRP